MIDDHAKLSQNNIHKYLFSIHLNLAEVTSFTGQLYQGFVRPSRKVQGFLSPNFRRRNQLLYALPKFSLYIQCVGGFVSYDPNPKRRRVYSGCTTARPGLKGLLQGGDQMAVGFYYS